MSTSKSWGVNGTPRDALARIRGLTVLAGVWLRDTEMLKTPAQLVHMSREGLNFFFSF